MALKTSINLGSPDKTEKRYDVTVSPRGYWKWDKDEGMHTYITLGVIRVVKEITEQTWFACTLYACQSAAGSYSGMGSYQYEETVPVLHSYTFKVIEMTAHTQEWVKDEE